MSPEGSFELIQREAQKVDQTQSGSFDVNKTEGYHQNREVFGSEEVDLTGNINRNPESEKPALEKTELKESGEKKEVVEKIVNKFLPDEVLDKYALSYEKSKKKTDEEKRGNAKYKKYYEKAVKELKPKLAELLEIKFANRDFNKKDSIETTVLKTLNSDMHANLLLRCVNDYLKKTRKEISNQVDSKEALKTKTLPAETDVKKDKDFAKETKEQKKTKTFETEKEFLERYKKDSIYTNSLNGEEFVIQGFDPVNKEVKISFYQANSYDPDNEAYDFIDDSRRWIPKKISLTDFEEILEWSAPNTLDEMVGYGKKGIAKLHEKVDSLYVNDKGEGIKTSALSKELRPKDREGEISYNRSLRFRPLGDRRDDTIMPTIDFHEKVEKENLVNYESEEELIEKFKEEFKDYRERDGFMVIGFEFNAEAKKYLAKIKEPGQGKTRLVTVEELREIVKNLPEKQLGNALENKELNENERIVVRIFEKHLEKAKEVIERKIWAQHEKNGGVLTTEGCVRERGKRVVKYLEEDLVDLIKEKSGSNTEAFLGVSLDKIINHFNDLAEEERRMLR